MSNIKNFKLVTFALNKVRSAEHLPAFRLLQLYKQTLEEHFGPGGTDTHMVLLYDYEINRFLLETTVDVAECTMDDINSIEFKELLTAFVLCIGSTFIRYRSISSSFSKDQLITEIIKQLALDFSS